jgi:hypothetical protein
MISAADFSDVFPWMVENEAGGTRTSQSASRYRKAASKYDASIARWEDDGGETWQPRPWEPGRETIAPNRLPH